MWPIFFYLRLFKKNTFLQVKFTYSHEQSGHIYTHLRDQTSTQTTRIIFVPKTVYYEEHNLWMPHSVRWNTWTHIDYKQATHWAIALSFILKVCIVFDGKRARATVQHLAFSWPKTSCALSKFTFQVLNRCPFVSDLVREADNVSIWNVLKSNKKKQSFYYL